MRLELELGGFEGRCFSCSLFRLLSDNFAAASRIIWLSSSLYCMPYPWSFCMYCSFMIVQTLVKSSHVWKTGVTKIAISSTFIKVSWIYYWKLCSVFTRKVVFLLFLNKQYGILLFVWCIEIGCSRHICNNIPCAIWFVWQGSCCNTILYVLINFEYLFLLRVMLWYCSSVVPPFFHWKYGASFSSATGLNKNQILTIGSIMVRLEVPGSTASKCNVLKD